VLCSLQLPYAVFQKVSERSVSLTLNHVPVDGIFSRSFAQLFFTLPDSRWPPGAVKFHRINPSTVRTHNCGLCGTEDRTDLVALRSQTLGPVVFILLFLTSIRWQ
jgi:hypothetical protein